MKYIICTLFSLFSFYQAFSQQYNINGTVHDDTNDDAFPNVTVTLLNDPDSVFVRETVTHADGSFYFEDIKTGNYLIRVQYLGYEPIAHPIELTQDTDIGTLSLIRGATALNEVMINIAPPVGEQKGDTMQFNAGAFQTMKDASAQSLIEKMPGIASEDGSLQAQGEQIVQIYVDGKPFFGTDVNAALQNLPAEVIQSVQIYDKLSDKAELSGFDDGEREKTINIITKPNSRRGLFGKTTVGYGNDDRYMAGASVNAFNEDQRITVTGLSNNINATNYSADPNSRGDSRPQNGIINTNRIGVNFSDDWGEKIEINASYLFSHRKNFGEELLSREYILPDADGQVYNESNNNNRRNTDHRFNMRFEYNIDSNNRILIRPNISMESDREEAYFTGNTMTDGGLLNETTNQLFANDSEFDINNRLFYSRRFGKKGRSLTVGLRTGNYRDEDDEDRQAENRYYDDGERVELINQQNIRNRRAFSWEANASYTEPIGKHSMVELEYEIGNNIDDSDKLTYNIDDTDDMATVRHLDTALSNTFNSEYLSQEAEIGYQYARERFRVQAEAEFQHAQLKNDQEFPAPFVLERTFKSVLPSVRIDYEFSDTKNIEFDYDARTNAPSVSDLQAVIDNSNPLQLRTGNPNLQQSYRNRFRLRYRNYNPQTERSFFAMIMSSINKNDVVTSTLIAEEPMEIADGIILERGSQLSRPVNLDGYWDLRSYFNWGTPLQFIPSNFNVHGGISYTHRPGMINEAINFVNTTRYSGGLSLSSNISDRIDFNIWTRSSYNTVENSLRPELSNNYFNQNTRLNYNWILWQNLVYRLDVNHQLNTGLSEGYDNSRLLVNMAIGKKLLKNERAEISVNVYDLFAQNNNIRRNISETFIEDSRSNVLQRYVMLSFTYNIRHFARGTTEEDYKELYN